MTPLPHLPGSFLSTVVKLVTLVAVAAIFTISLIVFSSGGFSWSSEADTWTDHRSGSGDEWDHDYRGHDESAGYDGNDGYGGYGGLGELSPDDYDKKITETAELKKGERVRLSADLGDVIIRGTDAEKVNLTVFLKGDDDEIEKYRVTVEKESAGIRIEGRFGKKRMWDWDYTNLRVRLEMEVPRSVQLDVNTSGGDIEIESVEGRIDGETSGGDISIVTVKGDLRMETSGGDINVKQVEGSFVLETSGGDIRGEGMKGPARVGTSGGDIVLSGVGGKVDGSTSGGDIRLRLTGNEGVDVSTSGGDISLEFPPDLKADVDASSWGGDVKCEFAVKGSFEDDTIRGTINGGGHQVRAETSGGDISINEGAPEGRD